MATGQLASWTFGTTGYTAPIVSIEPPEESVEVIDEPRLALAKGAYLPKSPGDLVDGGQYVLTMENDDDLSFALRTVETMTFTKPNGATWTFSGFIQAVKESPYQTSQRKLVDVTIVVAGAVTKETAP